MPDRPSSALLGWLRRVIDERGSSAADLAARTQIPRPRLRKLLSGAESMTVDELQLVMQALELGAKDFGLPEEPGEAAEAAAGAEEGRPRLGVVAPEPPEPARAGLDPWGNHPEQLVRAGFALGCDFLFVADSAHLAESGIPAAVLAKHPREMVLKLDAAYHRYNAPRYSDDAVTVTLSFDAVYDCTIPWVAIRQVTFWPATPEAVQPAPEAEKPKGSHLRLVT